MMLAALLGGCCCPLLGSTHGNWTLDRGFQVTDASQLWQACMVS